MENPKWYKDESLWAGIGFILLMLYIVIGG